MTTQLELTPPPADPTSPAWLENLLRDAGCWMTAGDIVLSTHGQTNERHLRELASASDWLISGQKGYLHLEHASAEEIAHAANWLESQAKKMGERAGKIRRNAHRRIG